VRFHILVSAIFAVTVSSAPAFGCTCVSAPPDIKTSRDLAQWTANRGDTIFEGRVERVEFKWTLLEAKVGDLVSADPEQNPPVMQVSFDETRSYRGAQHKNLQS
jgi:hypothetical protein